MNNQGDKKNVATSLTMIIILLNDIYLIRVVYIAFVINLSSITRVMLYQTLPVGTTLYTIPRFDIQ